jgi:hypothetical protein
MRLKIHPSQITALPEARDFGSGWARPMRFR